MASPQLVLILVLVTACILVQAENNQTGCTHDNNKSATVETATLVKELELEAVAQLMSTANEFTSTVMTLVKSEQERMAKVKAAVAEVKADMTSEMTIKAIIRELKAELTKDHSMAVSELKVMLRKQEERTEDLATDMKALREGLSYRLENSERKIEWAITDGSLAPRNTSWVMESFNQLGQRLHNLDKRFDDKLNQMQVDLNQIKEISLREFRDCAKFYKFGERTNGVYTIHPQGGAGVNVSCDMETDGGGWTVFQKRYNGEVDFYRGWENYVIGFGDAVGEYWLGLRHMYALTQARPTELYVGLTDFDGGPVYAKYGTFSVSSEEEKFSLTVGSYSGNASDSLAYNNGQKFSTKDQDSYGGRDCSNTRHGAWWYNDCTYSNLNGLFSATKVSGHFYMYWYKLHSNVQSMKTSVMMMRPANFKP